MLETAASALTSRTVPMNAATAPTERSPLRNAASSRPASKSSVWTRTGMAIANALAIQPPVTGGKSATSSPVDDRRVGAGEVVVDGDAHRAPGRELGRPRAAARREPCAQRADGVHVRRGLDALRCRAEGLAQARKIDEGNGSADAVTHDEPRKMRRLAGARRASCGGAGSGATPAQKRICRPTLTWSVSGQVAAELAGEAAEARVLDAQAERRIHVVAQARRRNSRRRATRRLSAVDRRRAEHRRSSRSAHSPRGRRARATGRTSSS